MKDLGERVHPTAVIAEGARLAPDALVGPYAVIGSGVTVGEGTSIGAHVVIEGKVEIGRRCSVLPGCCIGTPPQDKRTVRPGRVRIGDDNVLREYVTVHASASEEGTTLLGDRNYLMAYVHVAHDCRLGSDITIANTAALAGHVTVEDRAVIGGMTGVHQFVRIGRLAMLGGFSKVTQDIPPFSLYNGNPLAFYGINSVGLKRAGYEPDRRARIRRAVLTLVGSGLSVRHALESLEREHAADPDVAYLAAFARASKRGLARGAAGEAISDGPDV